jgi:hypothetical protein
LTGKKSLERDKQYHQENLISKKIKMKRKQGRTKGGKEEEKKE